ENGIEFKTVHLTSKEEAQTAPAPITTYSLFYNGEYLTNEQMNDRRFMKLLEKQEGK
ncbi:MAG: YoaP domain-containing protein, partial [Clostridia bacterium]|nr:YoaP domain-containing protein [Clostridia bacterium]